jgi:long-chain fatty acid transport protein
MRREQTTKGWSWLAGLAALLVVVGATDDARAAGFANTLQSGTSTAMGGVGVANPNEGNLSYYNPALMSFQEGYRIYAGPMLIMPRTSFESADGGRQVDTKKSLFPPPNLHAAYTFSDVVSAGIGLSLPYGLGIEWPDDWVGRENIQYQQLQTFDLNPNVAFEIPGTDLSLAVGGQAIFSTLELRRRIVLREDTEIQSRLGGSGYGVGATASVAYQPLDNLTLGVNYRSAAKINYSGRAHFDNEQGTAFEDTFVDNAVETELTLPHFVGVGVGWRIDRLFLEIDAQYTTWSTYDEVVIDFQQNKPSDTTTLVNNWRDAWALRFGASYEVVDGLPIRFGVAYDATPIPDATVNASLPGNNRIAGSLGLGYEVGGFRADVGYQLLQSIERNVTNDRAPRGDYRTTAHLLGINVGYGY